MQQLSFFKESEQEKSGQRLSPITYWKMFIDGAARNNPGPAGAGMVIFADGQVVEQGGFFLGSKTSNQAEYYALLLGLFFLKIRLHADEPVFIVSDSQLLVRQLQGIYKVKNPQLKRLHTFACQQLKGINYEAVHVLREENSQADAWANQGIDEKISVPEAFITLLHAHELSL